jgi:hypothetical protein
MAGRPTVVTPEVRRKVLLAVRAGNYREVAAQYAGISYSALRAYLKRKDDPEAGQFLAAVLEAESAVEIELVGAVKKMAAGDLKAATWYLARKFPKRWADKAAEIRRLMKLVEQLSGALPRSPD